MWEMGVIATLKRMTPISSIANQFFSQVSKSMWAFCPGQERLFEHTSLVLVLGPFQNFHTNLVLFSRVRGWFLPANEAGVGICLALPQVLDQAGITHKEKLKIKNLKRKWFWRFSVARNGGKKGTWFHCVP
jgi:hypothetical protein